ncbi:MAG: LOG family protein [Phycisphaerae bacterium]|nr:LOG family protein [Phycisphaerae bacterium]
MISDDQRRAERDAAIREFLARHAPGPNDDLLASMMTTICRMARDGTGRGELKLLDRALAELRYAFKTFAPYQHVRKVSIFGSSRTPEGHVDYKQAVAFAQRIRANNWMVITGAGDGIMKAGHGGAGREASFGVAIRLPFEQRTNTIIADDPKLVNFKYFFTRKLLFMKEASAVALFPGGFGTQDEGFEVLTLVQTGKAPLVPIVLVDAPRGTYWQHWRTYVQSELLRTGMISPEDMNLFRVTDNIEVAVQEILQFYRRYHSMRFVNDRLILRLNEPVPAAIVERMNDEFGDIVDKGRIEVVPTASEESEEVPHLPRIGLWFNRRSHGRLRQLIDFINNHDLPTMAAAGASTATA